MPVSRKKSCAPCRASKARCSLALPCSRCTERNLRCTYDGVLASRRQRLPPAVSSSTSISEASTRVEILLPEISSALVVPSRTGSSSDRHLFEWAGDIGLGARLPQSPERLSTSQGLWNDAMSAMFLNPVVSTSSADFSHQLISGKGNLNSQGGTGVSRGLPIHQVRAGISWRSTSVPLDEDVPLSTCTASSPRSAVSNTMNASSPSESDRSAIPTTSVTGRHGKTLLRHGHAAREPYPNGETLFGQLVSYPRMMVDGKGRLPPFIHPRCVIDGKSVQECLSMENGNHACLSEMLAVCTSLLHMFYTKTPASSDFVWRAIYDHQRQIHLEASTNLQLSMEHENT
jgi:hypothetical protein